MIERVVVVASLLVAACSNLPPAELDACGDGIVEPERGEDCDREGAGCGAPDTPQACRLTCVTSADCPATAACGPGGVCAVPDGRLRHAGDQAWTAPFLLVGDTTGGGDPELVGLDDIAIDVRVGGPGAEFGAADPIPNLPILDQPRLTDLTGDGRADVAMSVGIGIHVLTGDPDALLAPTFQAALPVPSTGALLASSIPYVSEGRLPATSVAIALRVPPSPDCAAPAGCEALLLGDAGAGLPSALDRLAGDRLAWARRPGPAGEQHVTIVLPFVDDPAVIGDQSAVWIAHGQLAISHPPPLPETETIAIVGPYPIAQGRVLAADLADLDGDGLADLLVTAEAADGAIALLFGKGRADASFAPPVELRARAAGTLDPLEALPPAIAWGDLDGDGKADMIGAQFALSLSCLGGACAFDVLAFVDQPWTHAAVSDLNGDGRADLIATRAAGSNVDVLLGTGVAGFWNDASFTAPGEVGVMRTGDFDGNGLGDVAMSVATGDPGAGAAIAVAFGRAFTRPDPPVRMGAIGDVVTLEPVLAPAPGRFDVVDDLLVITDRGGERRGAILFGSTSQRLIAPLLPGDDPTLPDGTPGIDLVDAVVAVQSAPGAGATLAALVTTVHERTGLPLVNSLRFFAADADGVLTEHYGGALGTLAFALRDARWTTIPGTADQPPLVVGADAEGRVVTVPIEGCPDDCHALPARWLVTSDGGARATALITADLDHQGPRDLVGLADGGAAGPGELVVWRGGAGTAERTTLPAGLVPLSVAAITTAVGQPATLVIAARGTGDAARGGVLVAVPDGSGRYPTVVDATAAGLIDRPEQAAVQVESADVDGDGLDDLIVVAGVDPRTPRSLAVYTQGQVAGGAGLAATAAGGGQ